ncbi:hypothetical protein [Bdellovibrio reynosensis]|uniref:Uncharacterized protein n=1 Tax=Bdellovibrio reynosensis TaxID=2835041 RepID=A0ABY4CCU8_9BACT|nr:hypothetical protein [Bdellovibrio reynosensis]UOF01541.1 hypothetical protein MNR06_01055 [Bdellovibrio reynosensis]
MLYVLRILIFLSFILLIACAPPERGDVDVKALNKHKMRFDNHGYVHFNLLQGENLSQEEIQKHLKFEFAYTDKGSVDFLSDHVKYDKSLPQPYGKVDATEVQELNCNNSDEVVELPKKIKVDVLKLCGKIAFNGDDLEIWANKLILSDVEWVITKNAEYAFTSIPTLFIQTLELVGENKILLQGPKKPKVMNNSSSLNIFVRNLSAADGALTVRSVSAPVFLTAKEFQEMFKKSLPTPAE